ncbi:hypothetical protein NL676_008282 [Syzygium grande]|nr:hypothetical protein NL676_008282 [Syzygium grande]
MGPLRSSFSSSSTRPILAMSKLFLLLLLLLLPSVSGAATKGTDSRKPFKVGVILNLDSSLGDQMRMAIEIACQDANNISSGSYYIEPHYVNSRANPLRAISTAKKLIRKKVRVIIGLETWQEATLVAEIANQSRVPVISFAANHAPPTLLAQTIWPSLFRMSTDVFDQIRCIADIVSSGNRRRVTILYEAEAYDTSYSELLNSLSEELDKIGSKIEDRDIIIGLRNSSGYGDQLTSGNIAALFLEYPYERAFLAKYCYGYAVTHENYRFGGLGFVFPKGSPLAAKFSQAILKLSESGEIKRLEDKWFPRECTMRNNTGKTPRLGLDSFWALYAFTIATSTACLLVACLCTRRSRQVHEEVTNGDSISQDLSIS